MVHPKSSKKIDGESDSDAGCQKFMAPFGRPVLQPSGEGASRSIGAVCSNWGAVDRQNLGAAVDNMLSRLSSLRQSSNHNKPAELFRKDLISAMKLPDSEILNTDDFYEIGDCWRQDWEKGVQVPVNPDTLHNATAKKVENKGPQTPLYDFRMPKKYLHAIEDENYRHGVHELTGMQQLAEQVVRYDLDDQDVAWLSRINQDRQIMGDLTIQEWTMERVLEALETECHERLSETIRNSEGLGIEYDEDVICDVCRSPDSEETNEMVFCDKCDICLHQACYGIQTIPEGSWLCRTCALGVQPDCILCPNKGGAMKSTKSGNKWCHVSCALWIPEVVIGCVEKMEPITKISQIPCSRWELICCICRERQGACIQCCVKSCKTSFHVTCAFNDNLDMKTILGDEQEEIKLKAFCPRHSCKKSTDDQGNPLPTPCSPRKQYTEEEKKNLRQKRIQQIEEEFYACVDVSDICAKLAICDDVVRDVYEYWKLKRRANFNRPLLMARREEADLLSKQQEDSLVARMRMFIHLRQDLERVRNLCYMVSRREKTRRSLYNMKEQIFNKQMEVVVTELVVSSREMDRIVALNHASDIYDRPDYILDTSRRFDDVTGKDSDVGNDVVKEEETSTSTSTPKQKKLAPLNGVLNDSKRRQLAQARLLSDAECALASLSSDAEHLPASDRVSTSPESDTSGSVSSLKTERVNAQSMQSTRLVPSKRVPGTQNERVRGMPAKDWTARESRVQETRQYEVSMVSSSSVNKVTVAGHTIRVRGLKRVTSLPCLKSKRMARDGDIRMDNAKKKDGNLTNERINRLNECNVVIDDCACTPHKMMNAPGKNFSKSGNRNNSVKSSKMSRQSEPEPERNLRPSEARSAQLDSRPSKSERTLRPAPRNLMESFQRVELSVANSRVTPSDVVASQGSSGGVTSTVSKGEVSPKEERRVEPLRVNLGKRLDVETESTSSEASLRSSSSSTVNGYRLPSDVNGRHRHRTKRRHTTPTKRHASPVKCTLISPGKLKLTLTDQIKTEPVKKSELCQSFVSHSQTSPYKSEPVVSNAEKRRSKSENKISKAETKPDSKQSNYTSEKRILRTTVSVADLLKLRQSRKMNMAAELNSDSGESTAKRSRTSHSMADLVDSDSDCSRGKAHRRSHHS